MRCLSYRDELLLVETVFESHGCRKGQQMVKASVPSGCREGQQMVKASVLLSLSLSPPLLFQTQSPSFHDAGLCR